MPCSRRQPARRSPFLYAQAIDEKRLTAASLLDDAPINLAAGGGLYIPQNYDKDFKGWVSVRSALGGSLNVPAVRTLVLVTPHRFARTLTALGLPLAQEGDYYGFSLALGSADVTLLSLTNAYRALANGGVARKVIDVPAPASGAAGASDASPARAADGTRVFSDAASFVVTDILSDNNARVRTFGFDNPLATRFFSAVKTGTSKDMRDNWTVGFTSRYTVGVWVGNADGSPMWDVSGVTGASPVWSAVVGYLHRDQPSRAPRAPAGVETRRITFERDIEPSRNEWFIAGTAVDTIRLAAPVTPGKDGARAPDDRHADRRHDLRDRSGHSAEEPADLVRALGRRATKFAWRLDDKVIGHADRIAWMPWPGRHRLELVDARGNVADTIRFEVRGAFAKASARGPN